MDKQQLPVFVYGTLRPGQGNYRLFAGRTEMERPALAPDLALFEYRYPFAQPYSDSTVVGDLMVISPQHYAHVLADLDRLEGFAPDDPEGSLYQRVTHLVRYETASGQTEQRLAWLYLAGPMATTWLSEDQLIPGGDWVAAHAA